MRFPSLWAMQASWLLTAPYGHYRPYRCCSGRVLWQGALLECSGGMLWPSLEKAYEAGCSGGGVLWRDAMKRCGGVLWRGAALASCSSNVLCWNALAGCSGGLRRGGCALAGCCGRGALGGVLLWLALAGCGLSGQQEARRGGCSGLSRERGVLWQEARAVPTELCYGSQKLIRNGFFPACRELPWLGVPFFGPSNLKWLWQDALAGCSGLSGQHSKRPARRAPVCWLWPGALLALPRNTETIEKQAFS